MRQPHAVCVRFLEVKVSQGSRGLVELHWERDWRERVGGPELRELYPVSRRYWCYSTSL